MMTLQNNNVVATFYNGQESENGSKPYIIVKDLTDQNNDPTIYTTKVRGIFTAWEFIKQIFTDERLKDDLKTSIIVTGKQIGRAHV